MRKAQATSAFIFVTIVLDAIGIGLIIPSLPDVIRRFTFDESQVSLYFGYFISLYSLMQFLASPLLGSLSDRYGRRPVLLISLLGAGLDYIMMAFAPTLLILFIGRMIAGLSSANFTVASAYMADISNDDNRSQNFGLIGAAFGLGFILGPALGGLLAAHGGSSAPFLGAAALNLLNFIFGVFILPESLPVELRRKKPLKDLNPFHSLFKFLKPSPILLFIIVHFLFQMAGQVHPAIWTIYTQHKFHWTSLEVGLSLAAVGILMAVVQGYGVRLAIPRFGEKNVVFWGALGTAVTFAMFAAATKGWMLYATLVISCLFGMAPPALQGLISKETPPEEQGELQGSLVSLTSLACIISPLIATSLFSHFTDLGADFYLPGAPYYYAAFASGLAFLLLIVRKNKAV